MMTAIGVLQGLWIVVALLLISIDRKPTPVVKGGCFDGREHVFEKWSGVTDLTVSYGKTYRTQQRECAMCGLVEKRALSVDGI